MTFGTLGTNGWYVTTLTVNWIVVDPESLILSTTGCEALTFAADSPPTTLTCKAVSDGGESTKSRTVKVDKTPPTVGSAASRPADMNGWYNHPLTVSFSATDDMAGVAAACASVPYGGPDNSGAVVAGTCRDNAGNVATAAFSLKYDATPQSVAALRTKAGNRRADITWQASPDTRLVEVSRAPGVNGAASSVVYSDRATAAHYRDLGLSAGRKYTYMVAVSDEAGNRAGQTVLHVGTGALLSPAPAQKVSSPPLLAWTPVKGATYYNVQLLRGRRVLSAWPAKTSLQLERTWVTNGRRQRLQPGVYRWYVWPGYGRLAASRYGRRLGGSTFVVPG